MKQKIIFDGYLITNKQNGENDSLALVITSNNLKYVLTNGGNRVGKKSFPLSSSIGSLLTFECTYVDKELLRLNSFANKEFFGDYALDLKTSTFFLLINEIIQKLLINTETKMFYTYQRTIEYLKKNINKVSILLFFLKNLLLDLGIEPNVNNCVNCGKTTNLVFFSFVDGGLLCNNCYKGSMKMSRKELLTYKYIFSNKFDCEESIKIDHNVLLNVIMNIILYIEDYFSIEILNFDLFIKANS